MTMVSYAQNLEDVVLHRALCRGQVGFYIDAGAGSPTEFSITRHVYESGWRGIDVEPLPDKLVDLRTERPRDVVLGVGLAAARG